MRNILLINENDVKASSPLCDNVDAKYIQSAIQAAQNEGLEPTIGSLLYNRICNDIESGELTDEYKLLIDDYIQPYLTQYVLAEIIVPISYKFRNNGLVQNSDEHFNQTSLNEINFIRQNYHDKAQFYAQRLFDYLVENHNTYPEFLKCKKYSDFKANKMAGYKCNINV